ncbi:hypothetical protein QQZ08_005117 [Neonectria magnoliae]|uniref:Uncharacterized protein n=1 Tax=Neonectria magnoliae TaxID=2732573 RepID=A0ABR1I5T4_9HYPO
MRWWFRASDHQVKIILLAKFERSTRSIIIEKYIEVPQIRPGATRTRAAARAMQLEPTCTQVITITEDPSNWGLCDLSFTSYSYDNHVKKKEKAIL